MLLVFAVFIPTMFSRGQKSSEVSPISFSSCWSTQVKRVILSCQSMTCYKSHFCYVCFTAAKAGTEYSAMMLLLTQQQFTTNPTSIRPFNILCLAFQSRFMLCLCSIYYGSPGTTKSIVVNVELFFASSFLAWWSNAKHTNSQEFFLLP